MKKVNERKVQGDDGSIMIGPSLSASCGRVFGVIQYCQCSKSIWSHCPAPAKEGQNAIRLFELDNGDTPGCLTHPNQDNIDEPYPGSLLMPIFILSYVSAEADLLYVLKAGAVGLHRSSCVLTSPGAMLFRGTIIFIRFFKSCEAQRNADGVRSSPYINHWQSGLLLGRSEGRTRTVSLTFGTFGSPVL